MTAFRLIFASLILFPIIFIWIFVTEGFIPNEYHYAYSVLVNHKIRGDMEDLKTGSKWRSGMLCDKAEELTDACPISVPQNPHKALICRQNSARLCFEILVDARYWSKASIKAKILGFSDFCAHITGDLTEKITTKKQIDRFYWIFGCETKGWRPKIVIHIIKRTKNRSKTLVSLYKERGGEWKKY